MCPQEMRRGVFGESQEMRRGVFSESQKKSEPTQMAFAFTEEIPHFVF